MAILHVTHTLGGLKKKKPQPPTGNEPQLRVCDFSSRQTDYVNRNSDRQNVCEE